MLELSGARAQCCLMDLEYACSFDELNDFKHAVDRIWYKRLEYLHEKAQVVSEEVKKDVQKGCSVCASQECS